MIVSKLYDFLARLKEVKFEVCDECGKMSDIVVTLSLSVVRGENFIPLMCDCLQQQKRLL